jgi:hypothetical protein
MLKLSKEQAKLLAEFFANLGVAWLAAGIITPLLTGKVFSEVINSGLIAVSWTGFLLIFSLHLLEGVK